MSDGGPMVVGAGVGAAMSASCGMIPASDTTKDVVMSNPKNVSVLTRAIVLLKSTVSPRKMLAISFGGGPGACRTPPLEARSVKSRMAPTGTATVSVTNMNGRSAYVPSLTL